MLKICAHHAMLVRRQGGPSQYQYSVGHQPASSVRTRCMHGMINAVSASKTLSSGPSKIPASLREPTGSRVAVAGASAGTIAATAPAAARVKTQDWAVDIVTHVPFTAPKDIGLTLTVICLDGQTWDFQLKPDKDPQQEKRANEDLDARRDFFTITLPQGSEPAAVRVTDRPDAGDSVFRGDGKFSHLFLKVVTLRADRDTVVHILANSYISTQQLPRLFVRDDALTNPKLKSNTSREVLVGLLKEELKEIRGEGRNTDQAENKPRTDPDRIYCYDTYNDLGGDITKVPTNIRETLGGNKEFPYPRRLKTNRGHYPGTNYEKAPTKETAELVGPQVIPSIIKGAIQFIFKSIRSQAPLIIGAWAVTLWVARKYVTQVSPIAQVVGGVGLFILLASVLGLVTKVAKEGTPTPWVPQDDNFDTDKTRGFIGNAVGGILPGLLTGIDDKLTGLPLLRGILRLLGLSAGPQFKSVGEVLSLYNRDGLSELGKMAVTGDAAVIVPAEGGPRDFGGKLRSRMERMAGADAGKIDTRDGSAVADRVEPGEEDFSVARSTTKTPPTVVDLLKYDVPKSLVDRLDTWDKDEEIGRLFLAGQNPMVIEVLDTDKLNRLLTDSAGIKQAANTIRGLLEGKSLEEWAAAEKTEEPRLFLVDYWGLAYGLLDTIEKANKKSDHVYHAGRCILFRRDDLRVVPVMIELVHSKLAEATTYTPNDPPAVWQVAKAIFQSIDSGWHQLISHWLRTHASVEPFLIATRRRLPAVHPIFRLLMPHFRYTLPINAAARGKLINAGGVIESNFTPGPSSMQLSSKVYGYQWNFKKEGLIEDLKQRGFMKTVKPGKFKLRVKDYPYAEDGLLIWDALYDYFTQYIKHYYPDPHGDSAVEKDEWLQEWWLDVRTEAHPEAPAEGWMPLNSRENLALAATTIAWLGSGHHAAVNFGQYDYSGWMPSHSSLCRKAAPARGTKEWEELQKRDVSSSKFFEYISPPATATKVMSTIKLLSAHAEDEQYLTTNAQDWLPLEYDKEVNAIFQSFISRLKTEVEPEIEERNKDPARVSRGAGDTRGLEYTLLYPTSEAGVTFKGVPYSISI